MHFHINVKELVYHNWWRHCLNVAWFPQLQYMYVPSLLAPFFEAYSVVVFVWVVRVRQVLIESSLLYKDLNHVFLCLHFLCEGQGHIITLVFVSVLIHEELLNVFFQFSSVVSDHFALILKESCLILFFIQLHLDLVKFHDFLTVEHLFEIIEFVKLDIEQLLASSLVKLVFLIHQFSVCRFFILWWLLRGKVVL